MKFLTPIVATLMLLYSSFSYAGWASGGGKIHQDSLNPWFLENTTTVNYCIDIDEESFGVSEARAATIVEESITEWKRAFSIAVDSYYEAHELEPYGQIRVATQSFVRHDCSSSVPLDLRIQLGTLTNEQQQIFDDPKDYVGIAFRSAYDLVELKGQGFIYLSPSSGPLKPNHPTMHPNAWSHAQNFALKHVLIHELGHIFGVGHQKNSVMDEMMPELLVNETLLTEVGNVSNAARYFTYLLSIDTLFGFAEDWSKEGCGAENPIDDLELFGYSRNGGDPCGKVELKNNVLQVNYAPSNGQAWQLVGQTNFNGSGTQSTASVAVYLPPQQTVFTKIPAEANSYLRRLYGEEIIEQRSFRGMLEIISSGETLPLRITISPEGMDSTAIKGNRFRESIFYIH